MCQQRIVKSNQHTPPLQSNPLNRLLENEGFSPEEDVVHDLEAGLGVDDSVEVDLTEVLLLGLQVPGLHYPEG